jgi:undecaprenyl-diphosphatase
MLDAVLTGIAQGLAVLPGLSRSGLTVAILLGRGMDRTEALAVSFLMSIPASLGAALFAGLKSDGLRTVEGVVGAVVAMVVGLASIRLLLYVAHRANFFWFVLLAGVAIMAGGVMQIWL